MLGIRRLNEYSIGLHFSLLRARANVSKETLQLARNPTERSQRLKRLQQSSSDYGLA